MSHRLKTFSRQIFSVFYGSRKTAFLTSVYCLIALLLVIVIWHQMKGETKIILPAGWEEEKAPKLPASFAEVEEILVLNSYHIGYTFSDNEMTGIIDSFTNSPWNTEPLIEYLDAKHHPEIKHFEAVKELFRQKYRNKKFPVVIAADNPALEFSLKYRSQIFPDSPIVFCGINGFKKEMIEGHKNVTGIAETLNIYDTMKTALKLHPKTKEVHVAHDYTVTGLATRRDMVEQMKDIAGKISSRYLENMTAEELAGYLKKLPADSLVLALSYGVDKDGHVMTHKDIANLLSTCSPVPVYGVHEERIGYGIVGGCLLSGKMHGAEAAEIALKILSGEPASSIPVKIKTPGRIMFDYNQLVRFGIPINSLPEGSIIFNRPVSFLRQHLYLVITTLLVIAVLVSGIVILGFNIYKRQEEITERKRAEEALRKSEDHYRGIFDSSPVPLAEVDCSGIKNYFDTLRSKGEFDAKSWFRENPKEILHCASLMKIIDVNGAAIRLFSAKNKEDISKGFHEVMTSDSLAALEKGLILFAEGGTFFEDECITKTFTGARLNLHIRWSILPGHEENWSMVIGSMNDLTDLRNAEEYVKKILDTVDEGFLVMDKDLNILTANPAYFKQSKKTAIETIGKKCYEVSHNRQRPCFEDGEDCPVIKTFETGESQIATHVHNDGAITVEVKSYPVWDSRGRISSVIKTLLDITEKKKLEEEQLKSQKLESIGLLAGGIAHDFNNLLMGIFGYISLAKLKADPAVCAYLDEAEKALGRTKGLTQQLLTFSKGGEPVKKPLAIAPLIMDSVRFALSGSNVNCEFSLSGDLNMAEADEGQISQVIQNIVINAVEAMPQGGTLKVNSGNITVSKDTAALKAGEYVTTSIEDQGIGIPIEHLSRIFDPYFSTKNKGGGLGLATSYSIIKKHGGMIQADSVLGKGSTFTFYLPAIESLETIKKQKEKEIVYGKGRILVLEDEEAVSLVCREILRTLGYEAEFAENGEEALKKYRNAMESGRHFHAVILDLTIKRGMGGRETMGGLLALNPQVKAMVSSGYADDPIMTNHKDYGFKATLAKPYRIEEISRALHELINA